MSRYVPRSTPGIPPTSPRVTSPAVDGTDPHSSSIAGLPRQPYRSGQRDTLIHAGGDIANAEFERAKLRVRTHIPPDLLAIVDAAGLHQQVDVLVEFAGRIVMVRDTGAREG